MAYDAFRRGLLAGTALGWAMINSWYLHMNSSYMAAGVAVAVAVVVVVVGDNGVDVDFDAAQESVVEGVAAAWWSAESAVVEEGVAALAAAMAVFVEEAISIAAAGVVIEIEVVAAVSEPEAPGNFEHFEFGSQTYCFDSSALVDLCTLSLLAHNPEIPPDIAAAAAAASVLDVANRSSL